MKHEESSQDNVNNEKGLPMTEKPTPETIRRYLLGDLPENERAQIEDDFLGDAVLFEEIEDAENDLIDEYAAGNLSEPERAQFENHYLALPENRERLRAAEFLRNEREKETRIADAPATASSQKKISNAPGVWQSIAAFFRSWQFVPVAAVVILVALAGLWLATRQTGTDEISYSRTPTPQPIVSATTTPETNGSPVSTPAVNNQNPPTPVPTASVQPARTPENEASPKPPPSAPEVRQQPQTVTLALITGLTRAGGGGNRLVVPQGAKQVRLSFDLPAKKYGQIEARLETVAGEIVWRGNVKQTTGRATLNLPARLFAAEDYLLILSGVGENGSRTDIQEFSINSRRK